MTTASAKKEARIPPDVSIGTAEPEFGLELQKVVVFRMQLLWDERRFLARAAFIGLLLGLVIALAIPVEYESSVELMPPDNQSGQGLAMIAAMTGGTGGWGPIAGAFWGMRGSVDRSIGILQ